MAIECGVPFGVCAVRVTAVDAVGNVVAGTNAYVTNKIEQITITPNIEAGEAQNVPDACGCSTVRFRFPDRFNWFEITFQVQRIEPALEALLLTGPDKLAHIITDGADRVGFAFPGELACGEEQPAVAFEFWSQHIVGSAQDPTYPWIHFVFPKTIWQRAESSYSRNYAPITYQGFTRTNAAWGGGPYGDGPPDDQDIREGGFWLTDIAPPDAVCDLISVTSGS